MLLLYTSQPLTSIASSLGFHSLSHFSKAFKAAEGISPLRFRQQGSDLEASEILRGQFSDKYVINFRFFRRFSFTNPSDTPAAPSQTPVSTIPDTLWHWDEFYLSYRHHTVLFR